MNCLHYCAFFDSPVLCELLLKQSKVSSCMKSHILLEFPSFWIIVSVLNQTCSSLKKNTPLHLACAALSLPTAQVLLKAGADKHLVDEQQRTPTGEIEIRNNEYEIFFSCSIRLHSKHTYNRSTTNCRYDETTSSRTVIGTSIFDFI